MELPDGSGWGGLGAAATALVFGGYKIWQTLKQDSKGDNVDARIQQFTSTLQTQLDKAIARTDVLQTSYNAVVSELASAKARAEVLAIQNGDLLRELQGLRAQTTKGTG